MSIVAAMLGLAAIALIVLFTAGLVIVGLGIIALLHANDCVHCGGRRNKRETGTTGRLFTLTCPECWRTETVVRR